jgi:uncharacterized protein DUF4339
MPSKEWFCQINGVEIGPIESPQLKQLAACGTVKPSDLVRLGASGAWVAAWNVRGLFAANAVSQSPAVATPPTTAGVPAIQAAIPTAIPLAVQLPAVATQSQGAPSHGSAAAEQWTDVLASRIKKAIAGNYEAVSPAIKKDQATTSNDVETFAKVAVAAIAFFAIAWIIVVAKREPEKYRAGPWTPDPSRTSYGQSASDRRSATLDAGDGMFGASDYESYKRVTRLSVAGDAQGIGQMEANGNVSVITGNPHVRIVTPGIFSSEVRIMDGPNAGKMVTVDNEALK